MSDCKYCDLRNIGKGEPHRWLCPGLEIEELTKERDRAINDLRDVYSNIENLDANTFKRVQSYEDAPVHDGQEPAKRGGPHDNLADDLRRD